MALSDPRRYAPRETIWHEVFVRRRAAQLAPLVTPERLEDLRDNPREEHGDHDGVLSEIVNFVRGEAPMQARPFVFVDEPGRRYRLARMNGRGEPADVDGPLFATEQDAIIAVVRERLRTLGIECVERAAS